jgi:hypothetical protein
MRRYDEDCPDRSSYRPGYRAGLFVLGQVTIPIAEDNLPMKADTYTKVVLTIIAFMLTLIACKTVATPERTVAADGPFAGVQFAGPQGQQFKFFDSRTGDIWFYEIVDYKGNWSVEKYKIVKLGDLPVKER